MASRNSVARLSAALLLWVGLALAPSALAQCNDQPCPVAPQIGVQDICYEEGLTLAPEDQIVYAGSPVTFYAEAYRSCTIVPVVNGCVLNSTLYTTAIAGNITYLNITMTDVSLSDSGLCISLHVKRLGTSCNDTVCLTVIGPPPSPSAEYIFILPTCNGIFINGSWPPNTTELIVVVQNQTYRFTSLPISINISGFRKYLPVSVIASNPAGKSRPYRQEVNFINFKRFKLDSSDIYIYNDSPFINITVQVNSSCPSSVPQVLTVKSNCLSANVTLCLEEQTTYSLALMPNRKRCYLNIGSERYNERVFSERNTSSVNDVSISDTNGSCQFTVNCSLISGARGCVVEVLAENGSTIFHQSINRTTIHSAIGNSTHRLTNGNYTANVYGLKGDGSFNHLVPVKTGIPLNCLRTTDSDDDRGSLPLWTIIVGVLVLVTVLIIAVITGTVITGTVVRFYRNHRRGGYDVRRQGYEAAPQRQAQPLANEHDYQGEDREPPVNEREDRGENRQLPANAEDRGEDREPPVNAVNEEDEQRLAGGAQDRDLNREDIEQLERFEDNIEQLAREDNEPQGTIAVNENSDQSEREENENHPSVPEPETGKELDNPQLVNERLLKIPQDIISPVSIVLTEDNSRAADHQFPQVAIDSNYNVSYTASSAAGSDVPLLKRSEDIVGSSDCYQTTDTGTTSHDDKLPEFQCLQVKKSEEVEEDKATSTFVAFQRKPSITIESSLVHQQQNTPPVYEGVSHLQQPDVLK